MQRSLCFFPAVILFYSFIVGTEKVASAVTIARDGNHAAAPNANHAAAQHSYQRLLRTALPETPPS
ncbi:MAG: hypothetical protein MR006_06820 [Arcanobacterium sp.]|nr:hypothetical protein [Arcanobacterium sp.]MDY5589248.1 hypothetical protein [Arcanobacterium sp.]